MNRRKTDIPPALEQFFVGVADAVVFWVVRYDIIRGKRFKQLFRTKGKAAVADDIAIFFSLERPDVIIVEECIAPAFRMNDKPVPLDDHAMGRRDKAV